MIFLSLLDVFPFHVFHFRRSSRVILGRTSNSAFPTESVLKSYSFPREVFPLPPLTGAAGALERRPQEGRNAFDSVLRQELSWGPAAFEPACPTEPISPLSSS